MRSFYIIFLVSILIIGYYFGIKFNSHSLSWHTAAVIYLFLADFVYSENKKNLVNRTFAIMTLSFAIWSFHVYGLYIARNETFARYWSIPFRTGMILIPPTFFHFVLAFTNTSRQNMKRLVRVSYSIALVFLIISLTGQLQKEFIQRQGIYFPKMTFGYKLLLLNIAFWLLYGLFHIVKRYRSAEAKMERNRLKWFLFGLSICVVFNFVNILPALGIKVYPMGGFASVFYTGIVAYAIVKYELMDIRVVISRGFTYASLVGAITGIYILTVGVFQGIFGTTVFAQSSFLVNAIAAVIIAASFQPLKNRIHLTVDKLFFKEKYNPQKILKEFVWSLASAIDVDKILNLVINTVTGTLHISKTTIFLANPNSGKFTIKASDSSKVNINEGIYFHKDEFLPRWLKEKNRIFNREEFEFHLTRQEFSPDEEIVQTLNKLKELDASLSIPLKVKDRLIGIFSLGQKMSEEMFTPEDIEFLTTLANQAGIALENAQLYEEMRGLEKNLSRADKLSALGTLASSIAHEIKNPLVAIKTFTQLLPRKFNDPEFQEKYNQIVPQELDRLENILNELLNFSRPSRDLVESVEIEKNIDEILLFLENEIFKSKVKVIKEYQKNLPGLLVNPEQMKQVFLNLILNALQSMPEGGSLTIATALLNGPTREQVQIRFTDTGCGIREENLKNIFKPFFSTKEEGTGLGLAIVKQIIKEHNGTIEVFSKPNQGTTFLINLPF